MLTICYTRYYIIFITHFPNKAGKTWHLQIVSAHYKEEIKGVLRAQGNNYYHGVEGIGLSVT